MAVRNSKAMKRVLKYWKIMLVCSVISYTAMGFAVFKAWRDYEKEYEIRQSAEMLMFLGSAGPFSVLVTGSGDRYQGPTIDTLSPGQVFSYTNTACLRSDVSLRGAVRLQHVESGVVVSRIPFFVPAAERPCGAVLHIMQIPPNAPAGNYLLLREDLILTPQIGHAQERDLPPIRLKVAL